MTNFRKLLSYYKPYKKIFFADMFFAILSAAIALMIPLAVRYVTSKVIYMTPSDAAGRILTIGGVMVALILLQWYCNFFIANYL